MGMAKTADLNGYPGPIHVLALAALTRRYSGGRRTRKIAQSGQAVPMQT
jgi:hypothetical protein